MSVFFRRRGTLTIVVTIVVTITGVGSATSCYATINGTKQYSAGTHEVNVGDTITFGVIGKSKADGWVKINGTTVLTVLDGTSKTYDWIVPDGISTIEIAMDSVGGVFGRITVTTA